jgi:DNA (cytosine-5)-methyltransferase 1
LIGVKLNDLTLFAVDTLASHLAQQANEAAQTTHDTCGQQCTTPFAYYDQRYAIMENVRGHLSLGFGRVLGDLAEVGYDAEWQVIPAAAVGAPHKRDRVFIVAYPNDTRNRTPERRIDDNGATQIKKRQIFSQFELGRHSTNDFGQWWEIEPSVGRVANGISNRVDRLTGLGNAIVPQVAELVGALVVEHSQN